MLPRLRELHQSFGNELAIIGVHSAKFPAERDSANLRKAVLRNEIDHPVINDGDFAVWQSYAVRAWPTLMFVDPLGKVIAKHEGELDTASLISFVQGAVDAFDAEGLLDRSPLQLQLEQEASATLRFPGKVLADDAGGRLFIADSGHHRVLHTGFDGAIRTVFGSGQPGFRDGDIASVAFRQPNGLALDAAGAILYVADTGNHALRAVDLQRGTVTTVAGTGERGGPSAGGLGLETALASPWDLTWVNERLWIAMAGTHQLWVFDPADGAVRPGAGTGHESIHDGPLASATFAQPSGLTTSGDALYVADSETSSVRRVDLAAARVRRLVGRGLFEFGDVDARGDSVRLQHPLAVAAAVEEGRIAIYVADSYNHKIKRLDPETREVVTLAGSGDADLTDGAPDEAAFWEPGGLGLRGRTLYVADTNNHAIREVNLDSGDVSTLDIRP